ncbi:hypothetical protein [Dactylosporangium sp. CA-233914]|uniref:hypothetical protein n=1 Tax=Dactylosporangium sp. CA-233914 TaxID=3239934 RepID=UPI003D930761
MPGDARCWKWSVVALPAAFAAGFAAGFVAASADQAVMVLARRPARRRPSG